MHRLQYCVFIIRINRLVLNMNLQYDERHNHEKELHINQISKFAQEPQNILTYKTTSLTKLLICNYYMITFTLSNTLLVSSVFDLTKY